MKSVFTYSLALSAICLLVIQNATAQTFFESVEGQTSIYLPVGGITRINTAASSLKIGYYYNRSDKDRVLGIDASGISNNGFAPLLTGKQLSPEAHVDINLGFKNFTTDDTNPAGYDYLNVRVGIGAAQYRLISPEAAFEQEVTSRSFNTFNAGVSYNYFLNGNMIFGAYAGYDKTNNISSLNEVTIRETTTTDTGPDGTIRTAESEYTAWVGAFESVDQLSLFLDYIYIPDFLSNRIALALYSRSSFDPIRNITNGGLGIYLNREGQPLKVVGGILYEFEDVFNAADGDGSLGERGTLGIVVGYNF